MTTATDTNIPIHQFTHTGNRVLLVKCVDRGGKSYGGFQWPTSGEVTAANWSPEATCESGGLFGWAWGLNLGGGKNPDYQSDWIVFAAPPESVIDLGDKQKAGPTAEVMYYGTWSGALELTRSGREAWLETMFAAARERADEARKEHAKARRGAASATGWSGAASATGGRGAAAITGPYSRIEIGPRDAGVVTADEFTWLVHIGAVILHRCEVAPAPPAPHKDMSDESRITRQTGAIELRSTGDE